MNTISLLLRVLAGAALTVLPLGCAQSKLEIKVDLFNGEPGDHLPLNRRDVARIQTSADALVESCEKTVVERGKAMDSVVELQGVIHQAQVITNRAADPTNTLTANQTGEMLAGMVRNAKLEQEALLSAVRACRLVVHKRLDEYTLARAEAPERSCEKQRREVDTSVAAMGIAVDSLIEPTGDFKAVLEFAQGQKDGIQLFGMSMKDGIKQADEKWRDEVAAAQAAVDRFAGINAAASVKAITVEADAAKTAKVDVIRSIPVDLRASADRDNLTGPFTAFIEKARAFETAAGTDSLGPAISAAVAVVEAQRSATRWQDALANLRTIPDQYAQAESKLFSASLAASGVRADSVASAVENLRRPNPLDGNIRGRFKTSGELNDYRNSQIDREQNAADPMLRILADPMYEKMWTPNFARTFTSIEGNNGVIITRDRIGQFRVYAADNDPKALIDNQLQISQTVAKGVTQILAAASGLPGASAVAESLPGRGPDRTGASTPPAHAPKTPVPAIDSVAAAEARAASRRRVRETLANELDIIVMRVRSSGSDAEARAEAERAKALLGAFKPRIERLSETPSPTSKPEP